MITLVEQREAVAYKASAELQDAIQRGYVSVRELARIIEPLSRRDPNLIIAIDSGYSSIHVGVMKLQDKNGRDAMLDPDILNVLSVMPQPEEDPVPGHVIIKRMNDRYTSEVRPRKSAGQITALLTKLKKSGLIDGARSSSGALVYTLLQLGEAVKAALPAYLKRHV